MQELSSAKYYQESAAAAPMASPTTRRQAAPPPPSSGLERLCRVVAPVAAGLLVVGGAATLWLNRGEIAENARYVDQRTDSPFNLVLWLAGSDKTFEDVVTEAAKTGLAEFDVMPAGKSLEIDTDFDWGNVQVGLPQGWPGALGTSPHPKRANKKK